MARELAVDAGHALDLALGREALGAQVAGELALEGGVALLDPPADSQLKQMVGMSA